MSINKIAIIFGTRPEIIKEGPIILECEKRGIDYFTIHTGQHYSYNMDSLFFEQLSLPEPTFKLGIKSSAPYLQGEHTGRMLIELEKILLSERPDIVLVHGDTNTALAGALTTKKLSTTSSFTDINILLGHVEAGLRSNDNTMPEEINRRIADHISDHLFAPTTKAALNAAAEGISPGKITVTGNTIVDALEYAKSKTKNSELLQNLSLSPKNYMLATVHRQENVDSKEKFRNIIKGLGEVYAETKMPIIYPIHPRSKNLLSKFNFKIPDGIRITDPVGFLEFINLENNAALIFTDSGGVQEESCVLGVPCVTLRENTERPETVDVGSNIIAGTDPANIVKSTRIIMSSKRNWKNPFGDGNSAKKIVDYIMRL